MKQTQPLRDKNGLTEEEFLAAYRADRFERPSVTVDIILFDRGRVLLIRRGGHPSIGKLAFPGGFLEPNETVEQAAARELMEETHTQHIEIHQLPVFSLPHRDPRTRILTVPFLAHLTEADDIVAGDDAADASFWDIRATDHGETITFLLSRDGTEEQVTVRREHMPSTFAGDVLYRTQGDSPLAGDHAEILAAAWDAEQAFCRQKMPAKPKSAE